MEYQIAQAYLLIQIKKMGTQTVLSQPGFNRGDWNVAGKQLTYNILRRGSKELQEYQCSYLSKQEYEKDLQDFRTRFQNNKNTVKIVSLAKDSKMHCGSGGNYSVVTERIPKRLSQTQNLHEVQALKMLRDSAAGFNECKKIEENFPINDQMIGFNDQNLTKVWINRDFSLNKGEFSVGPLNQQTMIKQLLDSFRPHVFKGFCPQFESQLQKVNPVRLSQLVSVVGNFVTNYDQFTKPVIIQPPPPPPQIIQQPLIVENPIVRYAEPILNPSRTVTTGLIPLRSVKPL